jgi:hypothetical protein
MSVAAVMRQSSMLRLDTKSLSVSGSSNRAMMRCRFSCRFVLLYERWHVVDHLSRSRPYSLPRIVVVYVAENWIVHSNCMVGEKIQRFANSVLL